MPVRLLARGRGGRGRGGRRGGRDRGGPAGVRQRTVADHAGVRAWCAPAAGGRPADPRPRPGRTGREPGHRQAPRRGRVRRRRRHPGLPLLRRPGGRGRRPRGRRGQPRRGQPGRLRAGRGVRTDHALELPAAAGVLEGRAGTGGRVHVRAQAERADPVDHDPPRPAAGRGRAAGRRRQPRPRRRSRGRCRAHREPAGRPGVVHRRPGDRQEGHGGRGRDGQEGRARAGRQEPAHRLRRRRPGGRRRRAPSAAVFAHSGQVCSSGARLVVQDEIHDWFVGELVRAGRPDPARRALRPADPDRRADLGAAPVQGRGVRRGRARRGRHAAPAAARSPTTPS